MTSNLIPFKEMPLIRSSLIIFTCLVFGPMANATDASEHTPQREVVSSTYNHNGQTIFFTIEHSDAEHGSILVATDAHAERRHDFGDNGYFHLERALPGLDHECQIEVMTVDTQGFIWIVFDSPTAPKTLRLLRRLLVLTPQGQLSQKHSSLQGLKLGELLNSQNSLVQIAIGQDSFYLVQSREVATSLNQFQIFKWSLSGVPDPHYRTKTTVISAETLAVLASKTPKNSDPHKINHEGRWQESYPIQVQVQPNGSLKILLHVFESSQPPNELDQPSTYSDHLDDDNEGEEWKGPTNNPEFKTNNEIFLDTNANDDDTFSGANANFDNHDPDLSEDDSDLDLDLESTDPSLDDSMSNDDDALNESSASAEDYERAFFAVLTINPHGSPIQISQPILSQQSTEDLSPETATLSADASKIFIVQAKPGRMLELQAFDILSTNFLGGKREVIKYDIDLFGGFKLIGNSLHTTIFAEGKSSESPDLILHHFNIVPPVNFGSPESTYCDNLLSGL